MEISREGSIVTQRTADFSPKVALNLMACLAISQAQAVEPPEPSIAGTYEILICKDSCSAGGDENVWVKGRVVLFPTSLEQSDLKRFSSSRFYRTPGQAANGCYALARLQENVYRGYAGIDKSGVTAWSIKDDVLHVDLYRSPDAGYRVTAQRTEQGFEGEGKSWGVGVAAPVGLGPDKIVMRRIGVADLSHCGGG
jgi:hypothetical protein